MTVFQFEGWEQQNLEHQIFLSKNLECFTAFSCRVNTMQREMKSDRGGTIIKEPESPSIWTELGPITWTQSRSASWCPDTHRSAWRSKCPTYQVCSGLSCIDLYRKHIWFPYIVSREHRYLSAVEWVSRSAAIDWHLLLSALGSSVWNNELHQLITFITRDPEWLW